MSTPVEAMPPHLVVEFEEMGRLMRAAEKGQATFIRERAPKGWRGWVSSVLARLGLR